MRRASEIGRLTHWVSKNDLPFAPIPPHQFRTSAVYGRAVYWSPSGAQSKQPAGDITFHVAPDSTYTNN